MPTASPLVLEPHQTASACVIWLHGLGADRYDFEPVARALQRILPAVRFVLPQAPTQPVTLNGGWPMPSWYDILALEPERALNLEQLNESADTVLQLIAEQQAAGIATQRIILAGFSQGGAVVLHTAFVRFADTLGGVLALSTYGPTFDNSITLNEAQQKQPVLCLHGTLDNVVPVYLGQRAYDWLHAQGVAATWHSYPMRHEVIGEEIQDIADWLQARLGV